MLVGAEGFEPPTLCSQSRCATRLRYAPTVLFDCIVNRIQTALALPHAAQLQSGEASARLEAGAWLVSFDATIERMHGGYSSAAERLTVAQDVVGSIPTSRPNWQGPQGVP
jgi:hypothetical protein